MTLEESLNLLEDICRSVPMVHTDHERVFQSLHVLRTMEGDKETALAVLDHVAKSVPLLRDNYELSRLAVHTIELALNGGAEPPAKTKRRAKRSV